MTERFGTAPDGTDVLRVTLSHAGTVARLMTWGASLQDFRIDGVDHPLVLGAEDFDAYPKRLVHFGAMAGPVANRIAGGRAPLGDGILQLERNEDGRSYLHGGSQGTSLSQWTLAAADARSCRFEITVPDGTGGLPGPLTLATTYRIADDGALEVEATGQAERPTLCALAHHSYWALDGGRPGGLAAHQMTVAADRYLPVDGDLIPLGAPAPVAGTRFDFRAPRPVMSPGDAMLDHNFCLRGGDGIRPVCTLRHGAVELRIATDQPGLQVYDGARIQPGAGLGGRRHGPHAGVALEPQRWPDAPNHEGYPPITLSPGETYRQRSRFHARLISRP